MDVMGVKQSNIFDVADLVGAAAGMDVAADSQISLFYFVSIVLKTFSGWSRMTLRTGFLFLLLDFSLHL
jgi:hypothetical protein